MTRSRFLATFLSLFLIVSMATPHRSWAFLDFDEDALKTTGIIIGITAGVVLLVVLIAGTVKDIKGGEEEEEDIWANLRKNRTLSSFPSLMAGAVLADDLRRGFDAPSQTPDKLRADSSPEEARVRLCAKQDGRPFRIGGSEIRLPGMEIPPVDRVRNPAPDSCRFALLLDEAAEAGKVR